MHSLGTQVFSAHTIHSCTFIVVAWDGHYNIMSVRAYYATGNMRGGGGDCGHVESCEECDVCAQAMVPGCLKQV